MTNEHLPIPIEEMSEFLEYDPTSKTGLRWIKKNSPKAPINIGDEAGSYHKGTGYYQLMFNYKNYKVHRIVYALYHGIDPGDMLIDHINNTRTDNRIENLRTLNDSDSIRHRGGYGKSKFKGVSWHKGLKKWRAQIKLNGKPKDIGYFDTEIEAAKAAKPHYIERDGYYLWPTD